MMIAVRIEVVVKREPGETTEKLSDDVLERAKRRRQMPGAATSHQAPGDAGLQKSDEPRHLCMRLQQSHATPRRMDIPEHQEIACNDQDWIAAGKVKHRTTCLPDTIARQAFVATTMHTSCKCGVRDRALSCAYGYVVLHALEPALSNRTSVSCSRATLRIFRGTCTGSRRLDRRSQRCS